MKVKVVTIPFDETEGFDDEVLQAALEGRDVVSVTDHFFVHGGRPSSAVPSILMGRTKSTGTRSGW